MDLTRISLEPVEVDVTAALPDGSPTTIDAVQFALLPPRRGPSAATLWSDPESFTYPMALLSVAGLDVAPAAGRFIVPAGGADLWMLAADGTDYVKPVLIERINMLDGGPAGDLPLSTVSDAYVAGLVTGDTATHDAVEALAGGGGVTDHGSLTGLADDDHPQYHTDARGDARYYTHAQVDTALAGDPPTSWAAAWQPNNADVLRAWFFAHTGPRVTVDTASPLTSQTVTTQAQADALIGKRINGTVTIGAPNLELRDFLVVGTAAVLVTNPGAQANTHIHHIEVDGQKAATAGVGIGGAAFATGTRVDHCKVHGTVDGYRLTVDGLFEYNLFYDPFIWDTTTMGAYVDDEALHADGAQAVRGAGITLRRSFLEVPNGINVVSAVLIKSEAAAINDVTVSENYLSGGNRTVAVLDGGNGTPTNVKVNNNRFGTDFGDRLWDNPVATVEQIGNVWANSSVPVPLGQTTLVAHALPTRQDPLAIGGVTTFLTFGTAAAWGNANGARWVRTLSAGRISKIGLHVTVQSGNIEVAVYRGVGRGRLRKPLGAPVARSGAVACPAVGYAEVALNAAVEVGVGDFLAMSCDNTTAAFMGTSGAASPLWGGLLWAKTSAAHPLPDPAPTFVDADVNAFRLPQLIGVA